jgi:hypothetical protein
VKKVVLVTNGLKYTLGSPEELVTVHEDVLDVEIVFARADSLPVPVFVPVLTICLASGDFRLSSSSWSIFSTSCSDISPVAISKYRYNKINNLKRFLLFSFNLSPVPISSH